MAFIPIQWRFEAGSYIKRLKIYTFLIKIWNITLIFISLALILSKSKEWFKKRGVRRHPYGPIFPNVYKMVHI